MDITVRAARLEDAADTVELVSGHASAFNENSPLTAGYVARYLASPASAVLLAEVEGQVAGLLSYSLRPDLYHVGDACLIEELVVREGRRDQGIGGRLMAALFARLAGSECAEVSVAVMPDNLRAINFYRSRGMTDEATLLELHFRR